MSTQKLAAARLFLASKFPYFTSAVLSLIPRESPGLGTFAVTERCVMLYDPECLKRWEVPEIAAVILHETLHVLRAHSKRCNMIAANRDRWNIAADVEINDDIRGMHLQLPEKPYYPETIHCAEGLLAEQYYAKLPVDQSTPGKPGAGWCGSAAGKPVPGEPSPGEGEGEPGRSEAEVESVRQATASAVQKHQQAHGRGSVPGGLARWAEAVRKPPQVPWQQHLARVCRRAIAYRPGATERRYSRPNRRQGGLGYGPGSPVLSAPVRPIPRVCFAIDTSGSVRSEQLETAINECKSILDTLGADVDFISCDAQVYADTRVRDWRKVAALCSGGGGTDFRPVFEAVEHRRERPEVLIFATDGYGPVPAEPPHGMAVIWLLIDSTYRPSTWGEYVEIQSQS